MSGTSEFACSNSPNSLLKIFGHVNHAFLKSVTALWTRIVYAPTMLALILMRVAWAVLCVPLTVVKVLLTIFHFSPNDALRKKRTVLISGGSTVQALHLARNFHHAGARVVMFEIEGCFDIVRFSTYVSHFYTVPKPCDENAQNYIRAVCEIVSRENVNYYVPVSSTSAAIYDALVKPHLELLNCHVFCPNIKEVRMLDDLLEILDRCRNAGMPFPLYYPVTSFKEIQRLYSTGLLQSAKHVMVPVGSKGVSNRCCMELPPSQEDFHLAQEISERCPWVVVQQLKGERLVTCTTVKYGAVVGTIVCRQGNDSNLVPVDHPDITTWIQQLLHTLKLRQLSGHLALELVVTSSGAIVLTGCRVGVTLPYICYSSVHPRLVWKPCKHFSRQSSGPLVADVPQYSASSAVASALKKPSVDAVGRLLGSVFNEKQATFLAWDPLPYLVTYLFVLPAQSFLSSLRWQKDMTYPIGC